MQGSFLHVETVAVELALKPEEMGDQMVYLSFLLNDIVIHKGR